MAARSASKEKVSGSKLSRVQPWKAIHAEGLRIWFVREGKMRSKFRFLFPIFKFHCLNGNYMTFMLQELFVFKDFQFSAFLPFLLKLLPQRCPNAWNHVLSLPPPHLHTNNMRTFSLAFTYRLKCKGLTFSRTACHVRREKL